MAGPWEKFGESEQDGPWSKFEEVKPEKPRTRGILETANDTVIEVANAAAGGVSSLANMVRPGNQVSSFIDKNIIKAGEEKQSDVVKSAKQTLSQGIQNADGIGGELSAVGKYVVDNPLLAASQAVGSFAIPGAAAKVLGRVGGIGAGAMMAGGDAAGTAYDLSSKAGATDAQALAAGRQASVIPALVGGVTGAFGAEKLLAGGTGFKGGIINRAVKTGLSEAGQEGIEEGITQYEGQRAAMPYDATIDPTKGVAASAGMGAIMGGATGAGVSLLTGNRDVAKAPPPVEPVLPTPTPEFQPVQPSPVPVIQPTPQLPSEAMGIDRTAGVLSNAAALAVDTGVHDQTLQAAQAALEQPKTATKTPETQSNLIAEQAINTPASGEISPQNTPIYGSAYAQRKATAPKVEPTDILDATGQPFVTGFSAKRAAEAAGEGFRPFKVAEKQFVVRNFATENIAAKAEDTPSSGLLIPNKKPILDKVLDSEQYQSVNPSENQGGQLTNTEPPKVRPLADQPSEAESLKKSESLRSQGNQEGSSLNLTAIQPAKQEAQNAPKAEAQTVEAGTNEGAAGATPAATPASARAGSVETSGVTQTPQVARDTLTREIETGMADVTGAPLAKFAIQQRKYKLKQLNEKEANVKTAQTIETKTQGQAPAVPKSVNAVPYENRAVSADAARTRPAASVNPAVPAGVVLPERGGSNLQAEPTAVSKGAETVSKADLAGEKLNKEWTAFTPESGTLNVPRAEMPQIKAEHRGAMVNFLKARGIDSTTEDVAADSLKPTQTEFSTAKVNKAKAYEGGDRSILVSSDGHVLDGHHQWLAKREKGEPVKVIKLNAPIKDLLATVKEFPSAGQSTATQNIATEANNTPASGEIDAAKPVPAGLAKMREAKTAKEAEIAAKQRADNAKAEQTRKDRTRRLTKMTHDKSPFLGFLGKHGINIAEKREFSPDKNPLLSGYGPMFRKNGLPVDQLIQRAVEEGYLPPGTNDDAKLRDLITQQMSGKSIAPMYTEDGAENAMQTEIDRRAQFDEEQALDAINDLSRSEFDDFLDVVEATPSTYTTAELDAMEDIPWDSSPTGVKSSTETAMREMGFSTQEIQDAIAEERRIAQENSESNRQSDEAITRAPQGSAGKSESAEEGLTAPTREGILAQQDRAVQAEKDQAKASTDAANKAKADSELNEFTLTGSDRAADVGAAGGQASMFDAPIEPVKKSEKIVSQDELRAKADLQAALADLGDIFNAPYRANMMPEQQQKLLPVLTRVLDAAFRLGYVKFKDAAKFSLDQIRAALGRDMADALTIDHLQGAYITMSSGKTGASTKREVVDVETKSEIDSHTALTENERKEQNAPSTDIRVERDSEKPAADSTVGDAVQTDTRNPTGTTGQTGGQASGSTGSGQSDGTSVSADSAVADGERSDQRVSRTESESDFTSITTGDQFGERGSDVGITGVPPDNIPASTVEATADKSTLAKQIASRKATTARVEPGFESIRATLPELLEGQQEDVHKAEQRFADPKGYGMLFTNGTGTGKTFTGLGIVKRFALQGKENTLIVVPDDKITADWIEAGKVLGLDITKLATTKDAGKGAVITTYANLGENDALASRQWDLVVPDEAHTLMQSEKGEVTGYLRNLRAITHHPDGVIQLHNMRNREAIDSNKATSDEIKSLILSIKNGLDKTGALEAQHEKLEKQYIQQNRALDAALQKIRDEVAAMQGAKRARLAALSATPFAYEKTIDWANGYLFEYTDGYPYTESLGYNQPDPREYFMQTRFGYSMRYNKLTTPDAKVDSGMMQRQFNAELKKSGALSGRMLDVKADYDRRFVLVDSAIGNRIDEALSWLSDQSRNAPKGDNGFSRLNKLVNDKFDYLSRRYLLEAIKAKEAIPIVKQHMAMGRKVVVFHDYKKGGGFNPFSGFVVTSDESTPEAKAQLSQAIAVFNTKFGDLVKMPLGEMQSPIDVFTKEMPGTLLINGDEKKGDLLKRYKSFQDDSTQPQVMLVQSAKNKGWSGHDTTGKYQRVLINLGQPTAPTLAIQQEGRIYRTGQVSNAIMRYLNTGTNWEKWAFATTIAGRASTAENLGMGEMSRALKDSFINAFQESDAYPPGHEGEGTGGKERDRASNNTLTEYDRAKSAYFGTQKKNSKTKAQEGVDYFATPEPVGLKMVQFLNLQAGEQVLEPSGGHGAIARWFPDLTKKTVIEPSQNLRSRLALTVDLENTSIIDSTFEEHNTINKYDGIAMNPPFGTGGKTAIEHLAKAATHLRDGGRIVALIPTGPSADKRFEKWMYETAEKPAKPLFKAGAIDVYKGDTLRINDYRGEFTLEAASFNKANGVVRGEDKNGNPVAAGINAIQDIGATGARTETYNPSADLNLVADIKLPQVTFERAGTAVATRIVVIQKGAYTSQTKNLDLSSIDDINTLFDRLENVALQDRTKETAKTEAKSEKKPPLASESKANTAIKDVATTGEKVTLSGAEYPIEIYIKNDGNPLRGAWVETREIAAKFSKSPFQKKSKEGNNWFVRERDFTKTAFSRGQATTGLPTTQVKSITDSIKARWENAPEIVIAANMDDPKIPQAVRDHNDGQLSQGAQGSPEGFLYDGKVYLIADQLATPSDVTRVLFHETLGHVGLRGVFGNSLKPILQQIAVFRQAETMQRAINEGFKPKNLPKDYTAKQFMDALPEDKKLRAAEEVLAYLAQTKPEMGFVKRAIAAIRTWLRDHGVNLRLTDSDIIANYILPARAWVQSGTGSVAVNTAFSRKDNAQTDTPAFKTWFSGSKVVTKDGDPKVMYTGTSADKDFTKFKMPKNGIWFTMWPDSASDYAMENDSKGLKYNPDTRRYDEVNSASRVMPVYLSIKNPYPMTHADTQRVNVSNYKAAQAKLFEELRAKGFDGVEWAPTEWVAIGSPNQIKSAIGNNGDFDASNPDIRFSRAIGDTLKAVTVTDIKAHAGNKLADYRNLALQFLGGRQLADLYGKDIPQIDGYTKMVQQMSADANEVGANADGIVTAWAKLTDERQLAELMHDATLSQIDPAKDYVEGDNRLQWGKLNAQFRALTPEAKKVYTEARDGYEEHYAQVREAIRDKIERSAMGKESKARMLERMDGEFFDKIKGVYFPLSRFGKYVVVTRDGDKVVNVSRAETLNEAEALRKQMQTAYPRNSGYTVGKVLKDKEFNASRDAVGRGFLKELFGVLDEKGVGAELQDAVNQLYLASMPDLSWAKHGIHRKGTPGFSQDARRAFAQNMFHGGRYLAKLRYADQLQDKLTDMQNHVEAQAGEETFDSVKGQQIVDEYVARHDSLMNPKSNPLSTALTSFGFVFHMGLSPASAMVNLSGTALVAYPIMGAKWGFDKAGKALLMASKQAATNKNDISTVLTGDERAAYDAAVKAGTIDVTAAHDLAGIAQGEDAGVMWKLRPVMKWASFLFHHAERFNRQATFVASYRLARGTGANHEAAYEQATKATYDSHFDYSASNRPRVMQGNAARVLLLFKQYGQNMIYTLTRQAQQAMNAETPAARKEARKALGGLLVMHASAAGVLGLPLVGSLLAMASMLGGSDDEPWDAETALRNMLADTFGQKPAEVMAKGFSRLTPWDISGRVGLNHLILPDIQEGLEGQRLGESAMAAALGPVAGIGINILKGMQDISEGHTLRGFEAMMPVALRSPLKALRYEMEGAKDKSGVVIQDEVGAAGVAGQALGFSPSEVRNATEGRIAIFKADQMLMQRRKELMSSYGQAMNDKDAEAVAKVRESIKKFNEANPDRKINNMQLIQSLRNKTKRVAEAENGVFLPKNRRDAIDEGRFAVE